VTLLKPKNVLGITLSLLTIISTTVDARLISRASGTKDAGGDFGDKLVVYNASSVDSSGFVNYDDLAIAAYLNGTKTLIGGSATTGICDAPLPPEPFILPDGAIDNGDGSITLLDGTSMLIPETPAFDPDTDAYECGYEFYQNELVELFGGIPSFSSEFIDASYVWTIVGSAGSIQNVFDPSSGGIPNQTAFSDFDFLQLGSYSVYFDVTLTINELGLSKGYNTFGKILIPYGTGPDYPFCDEVLDGPCPPFLYEVSQQSNQYSESYSAFMNIVARPAIAASDVSAPTNFMLMLLGSFGVWFTRRKLNTK
jgi:hypothetical protein